MYELQETRDAYVNPPEHSFGLVSRHRKLKNAQRKYAIHKRQMIKICGCGGWDHNHRIIDSTTGEMVDLY